MDFIWHEHLSCRRGLWASGSRALGASGSRCLEVRSFSSPSDVPGASVSAPEQEDLLLTVFFSLSAMLSRGISSGCPASPWCPSSAPRTTSGTSASSWGTRRTPWCLSTARAWTPWVSPRREEEGLKRRLTRPLSRSAGLRGLPRLRGDNGPDGRGLQWVQSQWERRRWVLILSHLSCSWFQTPSLSLVSPSRRRPAGVQQGAGPRRPRHRGPGHVQLHRSKVSP